MSQSDKIKISIAMRSYMFGSISWQEALQELEEYKQAIISEYQEQLHTASCVDCDLRNEKGAHPICSKCFGVVPSHWRPQCSPKDFDKVDVP